jgi:hypothetical protein
MIAAFEQATVALSLAVAATAATPILAQMGPITRTTVVPEPGAVPLAALSTEW